MIEDDSRFFWLNMACGLVRITRAELDAWIADSGRTVRVTVFDSSDGVKSHAFYGFTTPHAAKSSDGKIWFSTWEGLSLVDPRHLPSNKLPPPVHVEQVTADGKTYWQNLTREASAELRLPPRVRDLEIDYTALSLVLPEKNCFRVKLEGYDRDWRDLGNRRQAYYGNLSPRSYRFRVIASNNSGVWNETGGSLEFSIEPAFYQTNWFRALSVAVFLALLWLAYQFRVRQLQREYNIRLEERVEERTRIARELHDTQLQTAQGFMLRLQAVNEMIPPGPIKNELEETLEIGDRVILEGRRAVQNVRSGFVTDNLAQALRALGEELASGGDATFRLVVEGPARELHGIVREEIYSIAREALRNAFSHACASHIEAEVIFSEQLHVRIRDDGKGITCEVAEEGSAGHYGIGGMRERARQIGSKLVILSGPETGTEVELSVPGSVAYAKPPGRFRFSLFRRYGGVRK